VTHIAGKGIPSVYVVAFILAVAAGLFYAAANDGLWTDPICVYGGVFCDHPSWVGAAAILALLWGTFVRV
jgi:hypothetical protein